MGFEHRKKSMYNGFQVYGYCFISWLEDFQIQVFYCLEMFCIA